MSIFNICQDVLKSANLLYKWDLGDSQSNSSVQQQQLALLCYVEAADRRPRTSYTEGRLLPTTYSFRVRIFGTAKCRFSSNLMIAFFNATKMISFALAYDS